MKRTGKFACSSSNSSSNGDALHDGQDIFIYEVIKISLLNLHEYTVCSNIGNKLKYWKYFNFLKASPWVLESLQSKLELSGSEGSEVSRSVMGTGTVIPVDEYREAMEGGEYNIKLHKKIYRRGEERRGKERKRKERRRGEERKGSYFCAPAA